MKTLRTRIYKDIANHEAIYLFLMIKSMNLQNTKSEC